jgi:hypothetical protein
MALPLTLPASAYASNNQNAGKPGYGSANAADWSNGRPSNDVTTSKASVALARSDGGPNEPDYMPRTQSDRPGMANLTPGTIRAPDVTRWPGTVGPHQAYPTAADTPAAAPVVSTLTPNTAVHGAEPITVIINGTGFSLWSSVITGGSGSPWDNTAKFESPTQMTVVIDPRGAVPGGISVAVVDHSVMSNTNVLFTFT